MYNERRLVSAETQKIVLHTPVLDECYDATHTMPDEIDLENRSDYRSWSKL